MWRALVALVLLAFFVGLPVGLALLDGTLAGLILTALTVLGVLAWHVFS